jgi:DNA-binding transcriptional LysR family regulator
MELKQLRYFIAVVNECSFSEAARQIHIAQPALTRQVRALEEELGVQLLIRMSRGVELTAAGQAFYDDAQEILDHLMRAEQKARLVDQGHTGELIVGITVMLLWVQGVSEFLKIFRTRFPKVVLKMNTKLSGPQINALHRGQQDMGLLFFPPPDSGLDSIKLYTDHLVLVTQSDSEMAKNPPKKLSDIGQHSFIWFDREATPYYHDHLISHFHQNGFVPNVIERGSDNATMLSLVASGVGCTIVPRISTFNLPPGLLSLELDDLDLPLELMLVWRRDLISPIIHNMINVAQECSFNYEHGEKTNICCD